MSQQVNEFSFFCYSEWNKTIIRRKRNLYNTKNCSDRKTNNWLCRFNSKNSSVPSPYILSYNSCNIGNIQGKMG